MRTIQRRVVNAFIFSADNKILFGKSIRGSYEGCWLTPGGGIDDGETEQDALIREVREEVGIDMSNMEIERLPEVMNGQSKKILKDTGEEVLGDYTFYNFVIKTNKNAAQTPPKSLDDFAEATWHDVTTLANLKVPPGSRKVLETLGYL